MQLLGEKNALGNATISSNRIESGSDIILNNGSGNATITINNNSADSKNIAKGNVKLNNTDAAATMTINNVKAEKDLSITSAGNVNLAAQVKEGEKITVEGLVQGANITINAGKDIDVHGDIVSGLDNGQKLTMVSEDGKIITYENSTIMGNDMYIHTKGAADSQDSTSGIAKGDIYNAATILSVGDVVMKSDHGDVSNIVAMGSTTDKDGIQHTANKITLLATEGAVMNTDTIYAADSVNIKSKKTINVAGEIVAGNDINIESTDGSLGNSSILLSENGNITLTANNGHIVNTADGDIFALGGNVILSAKGKKTDIALDDTWGVDASQNWNMPAVINYGDIVALDNRAEDKSKAGNIIMQSEYGDVYNMTDFNLLTGMHASTPKITILDDKHLIYEGKSYTVALKNITMTAANGKLASDKELLHAGGDVNLTAKTGLNSLGRNIYAGGDITLRATDGNMVNTAAIESANGSVTLKADHGTVVNMLSGNILAGGGDVTIHAGAEQEASHQIYAIGTDGNTTKVSGINLSDEYATAVIKSHKYYLENGQYVEITDKTDVSKITGDIYTTAVYVDKDGKDVDLQLKYENADAEKITVDGKELTAIKGNIEFVRQGDALNRGDLIAMGVNPKETTEDSITGYKSTVPGTITISSDHGNVVNYDNFALSNGKNTYDGAYNLITHEHGNPELDKTNGGKKYLLANGNIAMKAPEGNFYNDLSIATDADLELESKGNMVIGQNFTIEKVGGNMTITSTKGSVTNGANSIVTAGKDITINAANGVNNAGELIAGENINMTITSTEGAVTNGANSIVTAGKDITINATNGVNNAGDIIAGESLYINNNSTEEAESEINSTGTMTALNGSIDVVNKYGKIDIDYIKAKEDAAAHTGKGDVFIGDITAGRVILSTDGAGNAVTIGEHKHSDGTTAHGQMTVDSYVKIQADYITNKVQSKHGENYKGLITFDITGSKGSEVKGDLEVENAGNTKFNTLNVTNAKVDITGNGGLDIDKLRVHDNALFNVKGSITQVFGTALRPNGAHYIYGDRGIPSNLYIWDSHHQRSNAFLIYTDPYYYAEGQRYPHEREAQRWNDFKPFMDYYRYDTNPIKLFNRYNIYETYIFQVPEDQEEDEFTTNK